MLTSFKSDLYTITVMIFDMIFQCLLVLDKDGAISYGAWYYFFLSACGHFDIKCVVGSCEG